MAFQRESQLSQVNVMMGVLAMASPEGVAHYRVVAIRKVLAEGILFFTQRSSRKVSEILQNPTASMTCWLPMQQREVVLEGAIIPLTMEENYKYWKLLPRDRQLKFSSYAPSSGQPIASLEVLTKKLSEIESEYQDQEIPFSDHYCGFLLEAKRIYFYTLGIDNFSEVIDYTLHEGKWAKQTLSP